MNHYSHHKLNAFQSFHFHPVETNVIRYIVKNILSNAKGIGGITHLMVRISLTLLLPYSDVRENVDSL